MDIKLNKEKSLHIMEYCVRKVMMMHVSSIKRHFTNIMIKGE